MVRCEVVGDGLVLIAQEAGGDYAVEIQCLARLGVARVVGAAPRHLMNICRSRLARQACVPRGG